MQAIDEKLLSNLPESLRLELLKAYGEITRNFRERRWEPSELNGGKLCEIIYSILKGHIAGTFPKNSTKPKNMVDACKAFENETAFPRSIRIQIPRMLIALYEIRNNRGVGHVGGDVDPNHMDATCVLRMSKWLVAELIRVFHNVSTEEASQAVETLVERTIPAVWQVGQKFRILKTDMAMIDKTLLLLYHSNRSISENDLCKWIEHSNPSIYRRDILRKAHASKLIEYDQGDKTVVISPLGIARAEEVLLEA